MILKENFFNHFNTALGALIYIAIFLIGYVWFNFDSAFLCIVGFFLLLDLLPVIYLHTQYYQENKGQVYEISNDGILLRENGKSKYFKKTDIDNIKIYMSASLYINSSFHYLGIDSYHFARIILNNQEEIIITCLMWPKVEEAIQVLGGTQYRREKIFFCSLDKRL